MNKLLARHIDLYLKLTALLNRIRMLLKRLLS